MRLKVMKKSDLADFVSSLIGAYEVVGPKAKNNRFAFGTLESPDELRLDYDVTLLPPKKYLLPQHEKLLKFRVGSDFDVEECIEAPERVLFGVHPYDIKAISQMDRYFTEEHPDIHYIKKRENTMIVGVDPINVSEKAFCTTMNSATVDTGFDLMLTDIGDKYVVAVGSKRGESLLEDHVRCSDASKKDAKARDAVREQAAVLCAKQKTSFTAEELPELLERGESHAVWDDKGDKCLSCGSCVLVCPSCFCFDVADEVELNLTDGHRWRQWDGCVLEDFAKVATGENFREARVARYRHRFYRKGQYLFKKFGEPACVGCGRCVAACLPDIANPVAVYNALKEE
jgi:ferredoxin